MHRLSRLVASTSSAFALSAAMFLAASAQPAAESALSLAAYQGTSSTTVTISVVPRVREGSCFGVNVAVSSDAGAPTGTVNLSLDGTVFGTHALPASGTFSEVLGCSQSRYRVPFSRGAHRLGAIYVPSGNWAPGSAYGRVVIYGASTVPVGNFPHGVDAGLGTFGAAGAADGSDLLRPAVSGLALGVAITAILVYRRRSLV